MNRIVTSVLTSKPTDQLSYDSLIYPGLDTAQRDRFSQFPSDPLPPISTFAPINYERGYAYPLVIWLHGADGDESELSQVMPHVSTRNFVAAAPRAEGGQWLQDAASIESCEERIMDSLGVAQKRFNVNHKRVFLVGVGVGGTAAIRVALSRPEVFAGAATLCGPLPSGNRPLRRINAVRELPLLIAATRQSDRYPETQVCRDLRLLHSAGCTVSLRQYPGADDLTTSMLSDLNRWVMEVVCGAGAAAIA